MLANVGSSILGGLVTANQSNPTLLSQQIIFGLNAVGLGISLAHPHSHYHVDLLGTGAFAAGTLPSLLLSSVKPPTRITWTSAAVATWSLKLAAYLFYRVTQRSHDARLDAIMENPLYCTGFWTYSALWGILCSLPYTLGLAASTQAGNPWLLKAGMGLFGLGFVLETTADYQKWRHKQTHPSENCQVGLWSLSQHPNYFGNLVLWLGILVANASVLYVPSPVAVPKLWQRIWAWRRWALALVGPAFMWRLFDTQSRGVLLVDSFEAQRKKYGYGTDRVYTKYVDETPLIIPIPGHNWFRSALAKSD